jgi:hypothetical protein
LKNFELLREKNREGARCLRRRNLEGKGGRLKRERGTKGLTHRGKCGRKKIITMMTTTWIRWTMIPWTAAAEKREEDGI